MTPTQARLMLRSAGFSPLPVVASIKAPPMKAWQKLFDPTEHQIRSWERTHSAADSTGILTRFVPTIDIDVLDPEAAQAIEDLVRGRFEEKGYILARVGRWPKRAILFRTDTPFDKILVKLIAPNGKPGDERLELLADGQQVVVHGLHAGTGKPYSWAGGDAPGKFKRVDLPYIHDHEARALLEDAAKLLIERFGYRLETAMKPASKGNGAGHDGSADWSFSPSDLIEHDRLTALAMRLVKSGMNAGAAINFLRSAVFGLAGVDEDRRQRRLDEIPGIVSSGVAKLDASAAPAPETKATPLPLSDFVAFSPDHTYIHRDTGEVWSETAVNARVLPVDDGGKKPLAASTWLDRNDAVEQRVWAPGEPQIIESRMAAEGGFFTKPGARVFNLYKPPEIFVAPDRNIGFWRGHLEALWPDQADHIERWFAHRAQRPGEKINHCLLLGGAPGIGKDAVIQPLKRAVGAWNFAEISPQAALGAFNEFLRSVVLRISEIKDLGDFDRFAFYEASKTLMAAPPDTLRCNPKYVRPYYVMNVTGVIVTTNHKVSGLYLPPDDRRHFVAWSNKEQADFDPDYWRGYWARFNAGGAEAVATHLRGLDLAGFNPNAPPDRTQAFWEMVDAMRSEEESEMADIIESLGSPNALTVSDLIDRAGGLGRYGFAEFLRDHTKARNIKMRLEENGYRRLANPDDKRGRWQLPSERTSVYVRRLLSDREGFVIVKAMGGK
jgi:hypothetical protein